MTDPSWHHLRKTQCPGVIVDRWHAVSTQLVELRRLRTFLPPPTRVDRRGYTTFIFFSRFQNRSKSVILKIFNGEGLIFVQIDWSESEIAKVGINFFRNFSRFRLILLDVPYINWMRFHLVIIGRCESLKSHFWNHEVIGFRFLPREARDNRLAFENYRGGSIIIGKNYGLGNFIYARARAHRV